MGLRSSVGSKTKTIPYVILDEKRELSFTRELELASLFILAEARREKDPPSAIARLYYPLHIHRWEGGVLIIDLLKLNNASIRYNAIPNVDEFEMALNASSDEPDAFMEALKKEGAHFKEFVGHKTVKIDGLIVQPSKSAELTEFLKRIEDFEPADEMVVFKPVMKSDDIESILDSLSSLRDDIEGDLKLLERAKRSMMDALDIAGKILNEEIQNIQDRSAKVKAKMRNELEKVKASRGKTLKIELKKIRKEYKKKATPLRGERTNLSRKLARRRKRLDLLKTDKDEFASKISREIKELEAKFEKVDSAVRKLEAWRDAEVKKARDPYKVAIKSEEDKIKEEGARSREEVQRKKAEISDQEKAVKGVAKRINRLIRSKKGKLNSLSRLCFDIEAETTDLLVPFYIFQYGARKFEFHPPVVACSAKGLLSRFKRILAENLQSKMTQLIKPRAAFMEKHLAKAVKTLGRSTNLTAEYRRSEDRLNLLRSREAVDKIMMGLLKIQREGWISDSEYIRLQKFLVENLELISRP